VFNAVLSEPANSISVKCTVFAIIGNYVPNYFDSVTHLYPASVALVVVVRVSNESPPKGRILSARTSHQRPLGLIAHLGAIDVRRKAIDWALNILKEFFIAVMRGDKGKITLLLLIIAGIILAIWMEWPSLRQKVKRPPQLPEGSASEDKWIPPSPEEVAEALKPK
jgi:hypothetical protein